MKASATRHGPSRHRVALPAGATWPVWSVLLALIAWAISVGAEDSTTSPTPPAAAEWTDARIEEAVLSACERNPIATYRGVGAHRFDMQGPLYLAERGDERARGVVLPTYLRLFLYGDQTRCQGFDLEEARALAGPETWVVLWRVEEPFRGRRSMTDHDQKLLRPKEVRLRHDGEWIVPVETRDRDPWIDRWYREDWDQDESLVAVFAELPYAGSLFVEWGLQEDGRNYLTESEIFSMHSFQKKWWALAHGEPEPKGGSWWKR